jgi:hemerythrin
MGIQWKDSYSTGLDWQDKHHKELLGSFVTLLDAMRLGKGKDEIGKTLSFLDGYVVRHFGAEEAAMDKHNYPLAEIHKKEHSIFISRMEKFKRDFDGGASLTLLIEVQSGLAEWFINHIGRVDKKLGEYVVAKGG